jgi:hypothetical protein
MRLEVDTITKLMKVPEASWFSPPSLGDVFSCVYCLGNHANFETFRLMGFYGQYCMGVETGLELRAAPSSDVTHERPIWTTFDLSVIPRPSKRPLDGSDDIDFKK